MVVLKQPISNFSQPSGLASMVYNDPFESTDLTAVHNASHAIGSAVIAINFVEQALDVALTHYFRLQSATFSLLPMLDFRSKMTVIQRDKLLSEIIHNDTRKRLHKLYDSRNILAHGYVRFAAEGAVLASGEPFEMRHPRHEASLNARQVKALHTEAILLLDVVIKAVEEITDFLNPLAALREDDPEGTPAEFIARLRRQIADRSLSLE